MAGRPRKPRALKILHGTMRKDRDRPEPSHGPFVATEPPVWVKDEEAIRFWYEVVAVLRPSGILTSVHVFSLGSYAVAHAAYTKEPTAAWASQVRLYENEFGLTPSSASKVKAPPVEKANRFKAIEGR